MGVGLELMLPNTDNISSVVNIIHLVHGVEPVQPEAGVLTS